MEPFPGNYSHFSCQGGKYATYETSFYEANYHTPKLFRYNRIKK